VTDRFVPTGARRDPIESIEWVPAESLHANHWNPNRVFRAELTLLERSLLSTGWIQPLLANNNGTIIDGFHRWRLSQDSDEIFQRYKGYVPVARLDVPDDMAMAITVRINRAKGSHSAVSMSSLAHAIIHDHGWTREQLADEIGATLDEVDLLLQDDVFTKKRVKDWAYAEAWYPGANGDPRNVTEPTIPTGYRGTGIMALTEAEANGVLD
jgi:hypothetical protein